MNKELLVATSIIGGLILLNKIIKISTQLGYIEGAAAATTIVVEEFEKLKKELK